MVWKNKIDKSLAKMIKKKDLKYQDEKWDIAALKQIKKKVLWTICQ